MPVVAVVALVDLAAAAVSTGQTIADTPDPKPDLPHPSPIPTPSSLPDLLHPLPSLSPP